MSSLSIQTVNHLTTNQVVTPEKREFLGSEISGILTFYASSDGQQFLRTNPLAEDNRTRWMNISQYLIFQHSFIPIEVRDDNQHLQAAALVSMDRAFYLEELATVPSNLGKDGKCRGAGTEAVVEAVSMCAYNGFKKFQLNSNQSSIPYYTNLGIRFEYNHGYLNFDEFPQFIQKHSRSHPQ